MFAAVAAKIICIDNSNNSCPECDVNATTHALSEHLDAAILHVRLCSPQILLEGSISINGKSYVRIESYSGMSVIFCKNERKFVIKFGSVSNMTLQNVVIEKCGAEHVSTSINVASRSSVYIINSLNIYLLNVHIMRSDGTGLTIIDSSGLIRIENCTFEKNFIKKQNDSIAGGGGLYIEFQYCDQHNENCTNLFTNNGRYIIQDCTFRDNVADSVEKLNVRAAGSLLQGLGRGGGLCIFIRGYAENNTFELKDCLFINNSALWGGGLYISLRDAPVSNMISVTDVDFERNSCPWNGGGGGAVSVGLLHFDDNEAKENKITFCNCKHLNNTALHAGGTLIYSSIGKTSNELGNEISFKLCQWRANGARFGAGVSVSVDAWNMLYNGFSVTPTFQNCKFHSNFIDNTLFSNNRSIEGKGSFLAVKSNVRFEGFTDFSGNCDTALYLVSASAIFSSHSQARFLNNTGRLGGAIIILGLGSLQINDDSEFDFTGNTAREKGGAIYQHSQNINDYFASRSCFIDYVGKKNISSRNISFIFKENQAGLSSEEKPTQLGNSIYAGSLHPCSTGCQNGELNYNQTFDCVANFSFIKRRKYEISSAGEHLTITSSSHSLDIIPGESIRLPITLKDAFGNEVDALYHLYILNLNQTSTVSIANDDNYISDKWVRFFGKPGHSAMLKVVTEDTWQVTFTLKVNLLECPPGCYPQNVTENEQKRIFCQCLSTTKLRGVRISYCNNSDYTAHMNSVYWLGYENDLMEQNGKEEDRIFSYCPPGYCAETQIVKLPNNTNRVELDKVICRNRTGKLCGKCGENFSSFYHSNDYDCFPRKNCNLGLLFFLVSEILPITIFFMVLVICDISITEGAVNGLVFYFQVTSSSIQRSSTSVRCPSLIPTLLEVYQLLVGVFNMKFFKHDRLSFCLWDKAQTLDLQAFRYVTITYSLLLVLLIIGVMRVCNLRKVTRHVPEVCRREIDIKSTIIRSLSGLLVICYSECTKISLLLLTPVTVYTSSGTNTAVFYNGELDYFRGRHLAYAIPALFFLIVLGLAPPLALLSYPLCYRILGFFNLSESKLVMVLCKLIPLEKFKPFFDSFQSSFKDKYRFYSGLYFIFRLLILLTFSIARSYTIYYVTMIIGLTFILCLHAVMQPYKNRYHNILDGFIFLNLVILEILNFYTYRRALETTDRRPTIKEACIAGTIFLYAPLVFFVAMVIMKVLLNLKRRKCIRSDKCDISQDQQLSESLLYGRRDSSIELMITKKISS
jgi:hypothetical protein